MARSNNNDSTEVHFQQGSCKIILKQGDLLNERDVDAIVIPTPENGQQFSKTYPLFEALCSRANQNLKRQINTFSSKIKPGGEPQIISSNTPSIILTPTPYFHNEKRAFQLLKSTYLKCLQLAIDGRCQTIAFPTIGCGQSGFRTADAADHLYKSLSQFEQSRDKRFKEIRIIIYDQETFSDVVSVFMELSHEKNAKIKLQDISLNKSNSTEMSSNRDRQPTSERQPPTDESKDYDDDFENHRADDQHGRAKKQALKLNPESPEYRPKQNNQRRVPRRYLINDQNTELHIFQGDILETKVDAIVNAANEHMTGGGGVDGVIHRAAGNELLRACQAHKQIYRSVRLPTGRSRILLSYNMSKTTYYIINTAGPRYDDAPPDKCKEDLISCYKTSLALANLYDLETIGFTAISCGIFGYPLDEGAEVALTTVNSNADSMRRILFVLKDDDIYDAWVKKAKELNFISLDDSDVAPTSTSKQPTSNTQETTEKPKEKDKSNVPKLSSKMAVVDGSTSNTARKPIDSDDRTPAATGSRDSNETSEEQGVREEEEGDDTAPNDNDKTTETKSGNKKSDTKKKEKHNHASNKDQFQHKDERSETPTVHKNTGQSLTSGGAVGRGRSKT